MKPQEYWDQAYQTRPFYNGKEPLRLLVEMFPRLQKGKVLDIGMGEGANAVFLAKKGMTVKGFDLSPVAVAHAQGLAKEFGVEIEAKAADLDLYLLGLMEYDTILMSYFKPGVPRYYSEIIRALKQGGTLLVQSYTSEEMREALSAEDSYKNFYYTSNELLHGLKGLRILYYNESVVDGKHIVQCLAQKPLDRDVAKYNLFNMHTPQEGPTKTNSQKDLAEALFKKK